MLMWPGAVKDLPTIVEASFVKEEVKCNGFIEEAARSVDEMIRTRKIALEAQMGEKFIIAHSVIGWKHARSRKAAGPRMRASKERSVGAFTRVRQPCHVAPNRRPRGLFSCKNDGFALGWRRGSTPWSTSCRGDRMVLWCS